MSDEKYVSPLGQGPVARDPDSPVDPETGKTAQDYALIRRSRVNHAIKLLHQNGIKPFGLIAVEEVLMFDKTLEPEQAAAVLDLLAVEFKIDYAAVLAPVIERVKKGERRSEDPRTQGNGHDPSGS